jgi:hypothetical protein
MDDASNPAAKYLNDVRSTDELIELALSKDADRDAEDYWKPIGVLQHRLPTILEKIQIFGKNSEEKYRDLAATILGQGHVGNKFSSETCAKILLQMLEVEQSNHVLSSIIFALGHLHSPSAVAPLVKFSSHPDALIRHAVVSSLCGYEDNAAIEAMITASGDVDRDVRNWATFGLGSQIDWDTPEIREPLCKRLYESDDEIRGEALVGLARRGDFRAAAALLAEINRPDFNEIRDWVLFQEAVEEIIARADAAKWLPVLNKLAEAKIGEASQIQDAIRKCK